MNVTFDVTDPFRLVLAGWMLLIRSNLFSFLPPSLETKSHVIMQSCNCVLHLIMIGLRTRNRCGWNDPNIDSIDTKADTGIGSILCIFTLNSACSP